jgi:hypothetical protein
MSGYVRNIEIKTKFDGRDITVMVTPLLRADLFKLQALIESGDQAGVFTQYADDLVKYVKSADVVDASGVAVPTEEWCASAYFIPLVTAVMSAHMGGATPANP